MTTTISLPGEDYGYEAALVYWSGGTRPSDWTFGASDIPLTFSGVDNASLELNVAEPPPGIYTVWLSIEPWVPGQSVSSLPEGMEFVNDRQYWELQPGSDTPGDRIVPWSDLGENAGMHILACLVDVPIGTTTPTYDWASTSPPWTLAPADTLWTAAEMDSAAYTGGVEDLEEVGPGTRFMAVSYVQANQNPAPLPAGWTPVEGPKYLGPGNGTGLFAGRVHFDGGTVTLMDNAGWWLADVSLPMTETALAASDGIFSGDTAVAGDYMAVWAAPNGTESPRGWPEGMTPLTSVTGPIAITDENAGGVIGDIAYVVSGYVYNSFSDDFLRLFVPSYIGDFSARPDGTYTVEVDDVFFINGAGLYKVTAAGDVTIVGTGYTDHTAEFENMAGPSSYWPYLERYDLKNKRWLPRVKLPEIAAIEFVAGTPLDVTPSGVINVGPGAGDAAFFAPEMAWEYLGPWDGSEIGAPVDLPPAGFDSWGYSVSSASVGMMNFFVNQTGFRIDREALALEEGTSWSLYRFRWAEAPEAATTLPPLPTSIPTLASPAQTYASEGGFAGVINGKLYFGGGDGNNGITGKEFFSYDPATGEFERLSDATDEVYGDTFDYSAFGVLDDKLYCFTSRFSEYNGDFYTRLYFTYYDPTDSAWHWSNDTDTSTWVEIPEAHEVFRDQSQGVEINGKLYFVYDRVYVFDPVALTVEAKSELTPTLATPPAVWTIDGLIYAMGWANGVVLEVYNIQTDVWSLVDVIPAPVTTSYSVVGVRSKVPYIFSGMATVPGDQTFSGVYGLTGNLPAPPVVNPTDLDPHNHRNPYAETNRFSGLYPDNSYPLVNGNLDAEQERRLMARQDAEQLHGPPN